MIEVRNLSKTFGSNVAVDDLSFEVHPGRVTGFLGPNGSGKSTTMRCMVGLDRSDGGSTSFAGRSYAQLPAPLHEVGVLLDAGYVHPGRSGRNHLRWLAASNGIARSRVDEVLALVGLTDVGNRKLRSYSLGMKQRLGIAATLLGDPGVIILDEPANGLDPEGIRWIRDFLKHFAQNGRTVLVSSHLLSEMALMADDLIVIGKGRLIEQGSVAQFVGRHATSWVRVRSPQLPALMEALARAGAKVRPADAPPAADTPGYGAPSGAAEVFGLGIEQVGDAAAANGITLHELSSQTDSLEDAFLSATAASQEYRSGTSEPGGPS